MKRVLLVIFECRRESSMSAFIHSFDSTNSIFPLMRNRIIKSI